MAGVPVRRSNWSSSRLKSWCRRARLALGNSASASPAASSSPSHPSKQTFDEIRLLTNFQLDDHGAPGRKAGHPFQAARLVLAPLGPPGLDQLGQGALTGARREQRRVQGIEVQRGMNPHAAPDLADEGRVELELDHAQPRALKEGARAAARPDPGRLRPGPGDGGGDRLGRPVRVEGHAVHPVAALPGDGRVARNPPDRERPEATGRVVLRADPLQVHDEGIQLAQVFALEGAGGGGDQRAGQEILEHAGAVVVRDQQHVPEPIAAEPVDDGGAGPRQGAKVSRLEARPRRPQRVDGRIPSGARAREPLGVLPVQAGSQGSQVEALAAFDQEADPGEGTLRLGAAARRAPDRGQGSMDRAQRPLHLRSGVEDSAAGRRRLCRRQLAEPAEREPGLADPEERERGPAAGGERRREGGAGRVAGRGRPGGVSGSDGAEPGQRSARNRGSRRR